MKKSLSLLLIFLLSLLLLGNAVAGGTAGVMGTIFLDANSNGIMDGGDKPLSNIEVSLLQADNASETVLATTTSNEQGQFAFPNLSGGTYALRASLPKKHVPTVPQSNGSQALPGNSQTALTPVFSLADGETKNLPIGTTPKSGYIKVIAFGDENANSGRFSTEPLLSEVKVEIIYESNGTEYVVATANTNKQGEATLSNLSPATYRVAATLPDPYIVGPVGKKISLFYNGIVPGDGSRGLSEQFNLPAGGSIGMGIGGVLTGKVSGQVWMDTNGNGKMDSGERGAEGVRIQISNPGKGVDRSMVTGNDGAYTFDKLQEGTYRLNASLPQDAMFTIPGDSLLSGNEQTDSTDINVALGQTTNLKPIGIAPLTSLDVLAFEDLNVNGVMDQDEPLFAGADIQIIPSDGKAMRGSTDKDGLATFSPVRPGKAGIRVTLPEPHVLTVHEENGSIFSTVSALRTAETVYTLEAGQHSRVLLGVTLPSSIAGTAFDDENLSSIRDNSENGIEGIQVEAINANGETAAKSVTNSDGQYVLDHLLPGTYTVRFSIVSPYVFSSPSDTGIESENKVITQTPTYGDTAPIVLKADETASHIDAGIFRSAIINGKVLLGDETDGFSGKSGGLNGVKIALLDADGARVSDYTIAETDQAGAFSLKGALPGSYQLEYTLPEGSAFSQPEQKEKTYVSEVIHLKSNDVLDVDPLFAVRTGSIAGNVFNDFNANGKKDDSDQAFIDASIKLASSKGESLEAVTDENGLYRFLDLRPGNYTYQVTLPDGHLIMQAESIELTGSQNNTASCPVTLRMGEQIENANIAVSPAASLQIDSFYDNDLSSTLTETDTPFPQTTITLTHELTGARIPVTTDVNGKASLERLYYGRYTISLPLKPDHAVIAPKGDVSGDEWKGSITISNAAEKQSIAIVQYGSIAGNIWNMDGSNADTANIPIMLQNADSKEQVANTSTDANGTYSFNNLLPGNYIISSILPSGFRFARSVDTQVRPSVITSDQNDAATQKGSSALLTLSMGQALTQQDIGIGATGRLGDFAWLDTDGDGMQDTDEPGIPGLTIRLFRYGEMAAETTTDAYGRYLIDDLYPGEYTVEIELPTELKTTKLQTEFSLVASVLPGGQTGTARAEGIVVPSKSSNLNCDFGFALMSPGKYPANLRNLPTKDWTPLVPYTPTR